MVCWNDPNLLFAALKRAQVFPKETFYWDCRGRWPKRKKKSLVTNLGTGAGSSPGSPPSVPGTQLRRRKVRCTPASAAGSRWSRKWSMSSSSTIRSSCRPLSGPKKENERNVKIFPSGRSHVARASGLCLPGTEVGRTKSHRARERGQSIKKGLDSCGNRDFWDPLQPPTVP